MPLASLATIRYWCWWASHDLAYLQGIAAATGKLDARSARLIAKDYLVARGVLKDENDRANTQRYAAIAKALNDKRADLISEPDMSKRLSICLEVVEELNRKSDAQAAITHNDFVSGISKLAWFIAPKGWTLFDRLAAEAVGIKSGNARDKATRFYAHLQNRDFPGLADRMNKALAGGPVASLHFHAERIVDQYLWLCGSDQDALPLTQAKTAAFLEAIGGEAKERLFKMGEIIQTQFAEDLAKLTPDVDMSKKKK
jgi:hypothetical protein